MARLVRHDAMGPIEIPPQGKSVWVCACGLSQNLPYCDGSHKTCRQEETDDSKVYVYDDERMNVVDTQDA